jgi:tyrosine-protein phosphatase SIW14
VWLAGGLAVGLFAALALAAAFVPPAAPRGEQLAVPGIANFGRVDPHLYRGAQPEVTAYPALKALGIDTVVRFSTGEIYIEGERRHVEGLGMHFVSLPWRASDDPTTAQVAAFLTLVTRHREATVFVHCREGADRTGVMVAIYRIAIDHWTPARAVTEMKAFHYYYLFHPHLQRYVESFPARLASEPALAAFGPGRPR